MIKRICRVVRGGSWSGNPDYLRAAFRHAARIDFRYDYLGFRLVVRIKGE